MRKEKEPFSLAFDLQGIRSSLSTRIFPFILPENRLNLLHSLQKEGFQVRMHGYEFFVWKNLFVCVLSFLPWSGIVFIRRIPWNKEESEASVMKILKILRSMDPDIRTYILA